METQKTKALIGSLRSAIRKRDIQLRSMRSEIMALRGKIERLQINRDIVTSNPEQTIYEVIRQFHPIELEVLQGKSRMREIVVARHLTIFFIHKYCNYSLKYIGCLFGGLNHATVIHAVKTVRDLRDTDRKYRADFEQMDNYIREMLK